MNISHDPKLNEISAKVQTGERLTFEDGVALFSTDDLTRWAKLPTQCAGKSMAARPTSTSIAT